MLKIFWLFFLLDILTYLGIRDINIFLLDQDITKLLFVLLSFLDRLVVNIDKVFY